MEMCHLLETQRNSGILSSMKRIFTWVLNPYDYSTPRQDNNSSIVMDGQEFQQRDSPVGMQFKNQACRKVTEAPCRQHRGGEGEG